MAISFVWKKYTGGFGAYGVYAFTLSERCLIISDDESHHT